MHLTLGGVRRAAAILAAVIAVPAVVAAPAAADADNIIGQPNLLLTPVETTQGDASALNLKLGGGTDVAVASNGKLSQWAANFDCTDGCGQARLVTLRESVLPGQYTVVEKSAWEAPTVSGVDFFEADLKVQTGDRIALEFEGDGKVQRAAVFGAESWGALAHSGLGTTSSFTQDRSGKLALFYATFEPLLATQTTVTPTPRISLVNTPVSFSVQVDRELLPSGAYAPIGGKVTLFHNSDPLPGCVDVTVTAGQASCQSTAPAQRGYRNIEARYAGDANYDESDGNASHYTVEPGAVQAKVNPSSVQRSAKITYSGEVALVFLHSVGPAEPMNYGTAAFFVDGQPVADCAAQPVGNHGESKCQTYAPAVAGPHTLKVVYSGNETTGPGQAEAPFDVVGPAAQVTDAVAFGPLALGTAATRTVTLTSSGKAELKLAATKLEGDGSFAVVSNGCVDGVLAPGATCDVVVTYVPTVAGAHAATLGFSHDGGSSSVTLSGSGFVPAAPPKPPTAAPNPGATIDPGKKPTFNVSVPTGSNPNAAPTLSLPLTCPANTECELDGRLTIEQAALTNRKARASAAATTTVAKFSGVQVKAGGLKTVKLKLSKAFVKSAQQRGIRRIRATLTINTVLGSGEKITKAQRITIVIPKAAKKVAAKQQVKPKFTG